MTYLYDKIMYIIIVLTLFLLLYLIFKKPKRNILLSIDELEDPPKYQDILQEFNTVNSELSIDDLPEVPQFTKVIDINFNSVTDKFDSFSRILSSKKADFRKIIFSIIFVGMIYFLFFSVLPGNERVLTFVCAVDDCGVPGLGDGDVADAGVSCTAYGGCNSGPAWQIGGEVDANACCGDDIATIGSTANYVITETANTDAPWPYDGTTGTACCSTGSDCVESGTNICTTEGSVAGSPPNAAKCWANNWYGGDNSETSCDDIVGAGYWELGGDISNCCGDDGSEYRKVETQGSDAPALFDDGTDACCTTDNDCTESNTCYNNAVTTGTIPNKGYCSSGSWLGGDSGSTECSAIAGASRWAIGGDISNCCGDDDNEFSITETSSTDAPAGYDDAITACCNPSTDCNYDDACTATGGASDPAVPSKAYCGASNTWYGGDYSSAGCSAIAGASRWAIGGEINGTVCCEDDGNENKRTKEVPPTNTMDNGYIDDSNDDACCFASTDCVNSSTCFDSGSSTSASVDQDSDTDYCLNGEWYDCQDNSDCPGSLLCTLSIHDCVDADGYISIKNIGTTGIEITNHEYTALRSVILELNYSDYAEDCRYGNGELGVEPTIWTPWESCIGNRVWLLTESAGEKFVYYQINYSNPDRVPTFNDSINYNYTGAGLDETDPFPPIIQLDDYINNNDYIPISWYNASDPESEVLGIPLRYYWVVFNNTDTLTSGTTTGTSVNANISSYNFPNNTTLDVNVTVINSAARTASDGPESTTIDMEPPYIWLLSGSFQNLTTDNYQSFTGIDEDTYVAASTVNFTWLGFDDITINVNAYSYILTQNPNTPVDNVPEGSIGSFDSEIYKKYTNLDSSKYYFKVKSRDLADNWGTVNSINFSIDSTAPSKPNIIDESRTGGNITITWYASSDPETNIANYNVSLFDSSDNEYNSTIVSGVVTEHTFEDVPSGTYTGKVKAKNGVSLWSIWSDEEETVSDNEPPIITATPNGTTNLLVVTSSPIIRAWTNEDAVCYYNSSSGDLEFSYTNTTYHETKILNLNDGSHSYKITCIDPASNSGEGFINFIIDSTKTPEAPIAPGSKEVYEDMLTTFTVQIQNGSDDLAGIVSDRFELYINDEETEFSVFDLGTGYYNVSFDSPSDAGSSYTIKTRLDSNSNKEDSFILTVKELYLSTLFEESGIDPSNTQHITADSVTDGKIGLASNTPSPSIGDNVNRLNISNIKLEDELFIFNTKSSMKTNNIENILAQQNFLPLINPSFGYKVDDKYIINFILRYDNFAITSEIGTTLRRGQYNTLVRNTLTSSGDRILKFTRSGSDSGRIVLQG